MRAASDSIAVITNYFLMLPSLENVGRRWQPSVSNYRGKIRAPMLAPHAKPVFHSRLAGCFAGSGKPHRLRNQGGPGVNIKLPETGSRLYR
jgi:hypothetical protein